MITKELAEAATEINVILGNLSSDVLMKIPNNIINFFRVNASKTYNFQYDKTKSLIEQNLKPKTKGIIAYLYKEYICDESQKEEYMQIYNEFLREEEQQKIDFNQNELFYTNKVNLQHGEIAAIEDEKNKWYTKLISIVRWIFKK